MAAWLMAASCAAEPGQILAAIEVPHGSVVETLIERGFKVHAINPKQMDRFRDRFTMAGAKDDSRAAEVMASALRSDPRCFRPLAAADPIIVELREWSRIAEDLGVERNRLVNRLREQLWRYFRPCSNSRATSAPNGCSNSGKPRRRRIRRAVCARRRSPNCSNAIASVASTPPSWSTRCAGPRCASPPERSEAASAHVALLVPRSRLLNRQIKDAHSRIDGLTARLMPAEAAEPGQKKQHDAEILASLPGVGRTVLATLLAEASDALQRRDYAALRSLAGVAPVTKRSGKSCVVVRRQACHDRLANAVYHWACVAVQHDPRSRAKYAELRRRGHSHGRALRSVADRLLNVACAMLKSGAAFSLRPQPLKNRRDKRSRDSHHGPPPTTLLLNAV